MIYYFKILNETNTETWMKIAKLQYYAKEQLGLNLSLGYKIDINELEDFYINMTDTKFMDFALAQKGMTNAEIETLFTEFLSVMGLDTEQLIIQDPYIFAGNTDESLLIKILENNVTSKKIKFITKQKNENYTVRSSIEMALQAKGFTLFVVYKADIHDRWWLTTKGGFACGTSFGGIGKNDTTILPLPSSDLTDILSKI